VYLYNIIFRILSEFNCLVKFKIIIVTLNVNFKCDMSHHIYIIVSIKIRNWTYKNLLEAKLLKISHFKLSINKFTVLEENNFQSEKANLLYYV